MICPFCGEKVETKFGQSVSRKTGKQRGHYFRCENCRAQCMFPRALGAKGFLALQRETENALQSGDANMSELQEHGGKLLADLEPKGSPDNAA